MPIVKWNRLRQAKHLARMDPNRLTNELIENDPEALRSFERPTTRWIIH